MLDEITLRRHNDGWVEMRTPPRLSVMMKIKEEEKVELDAVSRGNNGDDGSDDDGDRQR